MDFGTINEWEAIVLRDALDGYEPQRPPSDATNWHEIRAARLAIARQLAFRLR